MRRTVIIAALAVVSCQEDKGGTTSGIQSIRLTVTSPQDLGSQQNPLVSRAVTLDVDLVGADGQIARVDRDLQLYTWFLGTLGRNYGTTPDDQTARCGTGQAIHVTQGSAHGVQLTLPLAFGPVHLWVEDCAQPGASFAVGASPTMWFPYPTIQDVSKPLDLMPPNLFSIFADSPMENKQVAIDASPGGKLVVTGIFAQFYTVQDTGLPDWNALEVYSFSRPTVQVGDVLKPLSLTGAISEFNGMTELNFPLQQWDGTKAALPAPTVLAIADFNYGNDYGKAARLESLEAQIVELDDGCICPAGADYATFQQWSVAFKDGTGAYNCGRNYSIGVTTAGQVAGWDPPRTGHHLTKIRGVLVNIAGLASKTSGNPFSFFILHPRDTSDVVDAGDTCQTM